MKPLISFAIILILWEILAAGFIPPASRVLLTFAELSYNSEFINNVLISLQRLGLGWLAGMITGTSLGIMLALNLKLRAYLMPVVSALFPIPKIALLPLFLVLFGLGESGKVTTIFVGGFFPSIIAAYGSVLRTPNQLMDAAASLGASYWQTIRLVVVPYNLPSIIQGFRTSLSLSMTLLVAAEMLGAKSGLGYWIFVTGSDMMFDHMFAGLIYLSLIGVSANYIINYLRKKLCYWSILEEGKREDIVIKS